jgi:hypothetical protein
MGLCLFADDDYEEVATKVTGSLSRWGCWDARWSVPTASGITQARKRLGAKVLAEVFEQVVGPVATMSTRGAWLRGWRLVAIDGFEVDVADTTGNAVEFGYAGSGVTRSAFPKARVVALAQCGTHAFVAAEVGAWAVGEKTLANRISPRLRRDELLTADRNFLLLRRLGPGRQVRCRAVVAGPDRVGPARRAGPTRRHLPLSVDEPSDPRRTPPSGDPRRRR